ncbi:MAG: ABC transporter permease [Azonexus sp.]|jgi:putative ABC transport system permease protein|nr:ABC transporter permease [Azonexus sp.]
MIALSWRLLGRELRSGELRLLCAALCVAVAAVTAVGFFADRIQRALKNEAQQLMGGDLVLTADHPLPESYRQEAARRRAALAETLVFPSMVSFGGRAQLADITAVSAAYPLRGRLSVAQRLGESGGPVAGGPPPGTVWLDERLATALAAMPGDVVAVGRANLRVAAILTLEPDRGINFFSLAPRLMMSIDDVAASGLVQEGSRLRYRLLLAANDKEAGGIDGLRDWLKPRLARGERLEDASNARPEIRSALERAERFLGLATLLTVILAAVAVALAARRYLQRHLDACAVMRCFGMTQNRLLRLHGLMFFWLALAAALAGCGGGYAAHFLLVNGLSGSSGLFAAHLPPPGWRAPGYGAAVAVVLLFGFALPPLLQLAKAPPLRVLRRELGAPQPSLFGGYALGCLSLGGLIVVVAGDVRLGAFALGGFAGAFIAFWLLARLLLTAIARLRGIGGAGGVGWRQGLANLARHASSATLQIVALAVGIMAMLLLTVTRSQLLDAWTGSLAAEAPNRFIINIQPEQRDEVAQMLAAAGVEAELSPMIRARLLRIGGRPVSAASYPEDERAQRLIEREFNLSWRDALPPGNRLTAGQWFAPPEIGLNAEGQGVASVEEGLARTLGIAIGDELTFAVAGVERVVRVTSLRQLAWDSLRVNFFVLTPAGVIDDLPASYITSFHLPDGSAKLGPELVSRFPNLTIIDIAAILVQLRAVIEQVAGAVRFIFLFTLLAGGIVLYSALLSMLDERRYALAVMRALGARRQQLAAALLSELAAVGAAAGFLAAAGAMLVGQIIAHRVFQLDLTPPLWLPPLAAASGAAATVATGWWAVRRLLATPPLLLLRSGE